MWTCDQSREQMLPFLYELLEPNEQAAMLTHLQSCAACQEARAAAQDQQGLFAEAVKESHPDVVFKAPAKKAVPASTVPTLAMPTPYRRPFFLNRWSIAASLLLCLMAGGAVFGVSLWNDQSARLAAAQDRLARARDEQRKVEQDLNVKRVATQKEIQEIQAQIDKLIGTWREKDAEARKEFEKQTSQINVRGPQNLVAGAQNYFEIQYGNRDDVNRLPGGLNAKQPQVAAEPMQTNFRVVDQKRNVTVFEQQLNFDARNTANVTLPPDVPIKPGSNVAIEFDVYSSEGKTMQKLSDNLKVVAPEYITHLTTDRPLYRPGDTVRFRSITLERFSLRPARDTFNLRFRIVGPKNTEVYRQELASLVTDADKNPIKAPDGAPLTSIGVGEYTIPENLPAGQYSMIVSEVNERFAEEKRPFIVNRTQPSRLHKDLTFHRSSYGPGDTVRATVKAVPAQGQLPGGRGMIQVQSRAVIDNANIFNDNQQTNNDGQVVFEFQLPPQIFKGVGKLEVTCLDGGNAETMVRTIPILVRDLAIDFYPEGGDIVAGMPNRVYYQARTPAGRPADVQARLVNDLNQEITRTQTLTDDVEPGINQGLGSFTFTPVANRRYSLRIESPIGITRAFPLPAVKKTGVVLHLPQGVVDKQIPVTIHAADRARELLIGAYCRGRLLGQAVVLSRPGKAAQTTIVPDTNAAGVYRITAFEISDIGGRSAGYQPVAERLIYRKSSEHVDVAITPDKSSYQPRDNVKLSLSATTEQKTPAPVLSMVCVVDRSNLKIADEKNARSMPTHFLLTNEIREPQELENADVLLGTHPHAAQALDLLLGSQGWRRFAEQDPQRWLQRQANAKAPGFLANAQPVVHFFNAEQQQIEKVDQTYVAKAIELQRQLAAKEAEEATIPDPQQVGAVQVQTTQMAQQEVVVSEANLRGIRAIMIQFVLGGVLLVLLFVGFLLINVGLQRLTDGRHARIWFTAGVGLLILLFLASIIGTFAMMGERFDDFGRFDHFPNVKMAMPVAPPPPMAAPLILDNVAPPEMPVQDDAEIEGVKDENAKKGIVPAAAPQVWPGNPIDNEINGQFVQNQFGQNQVEPDVGQKQKWLPDERWMRQQGLYQPLLQKQLGRRVHVPPAQAPGVVREYANRSLPNKDEVRRDFAETVYWHPVLVLPDGTGQISFDLADSVTRYQVLVLANAFDGRLGINQIDIAAKLPFDIEPLVPHEVGNNDEITIPVAVSNSKTQPSSVTLSARFKGLNLTDKNADRGLEMKANEKKRELFSVKPNIDDGIATVRVAGKTTGSADAVERKFKVVQDGFPQTGSVSGMLENTIERELTLPDGWIPGSLKIEAHIYPTPLAELQSGIDALLREPVGCFEQRSSSNYPNVLILNYMKQTNQASPVIEKRARDLIRTGYQKLTTFECIDPKTSAKRGYEWFGGHAAPHEALTAYGLLQFRDMAKVYPVETDMLERTEQYLLGQRDGKGGFTRNPANLDRFGRAPDHITNAYILWALTEAGVKENLDQELAAVLSSSKDSKDPYLLALVGLSHLNRNQTKVGIDLGKRIRDAQRVEGHVAGAATSITGSQGRDLDVETTSLALLGWLKENQPGEFNANIQSAFKWLAQQRRDQGRFGSTQATILALKAMVAYTRANPRPLQNGEVQMIVRDALGQMPPPGQPVPAQIRFNNRGQQIFANEMDLPELNRVAFSVNTRETMTLTLRDAGQLRPGKNLIELRVNNNSVLPYALTWSCRTLQPDNAPNAPVKLTTKLAADQAKENASVQLSAVVENVSGKGQGMTVAIIGLPGGVALPENFDQLTELTRRRAIDAWELRGRELVLYWRELAPDAKLAVDLDVICQLPGHYHGPASRAYLYYDSERKHWTNPLSLRILERE